MNQDLLNELAAAMRSNPDLSVLEVITLATDLRFPTRRIDHIDGKPTNKKHKLSNEDILAALTQYNDLRQKDAARLLRSVGQRNDAIDSHTH